MTFLLVSAVKNIFIIRTRLPISLWSKPMTTTASSLFFFFILSILVKSYSLCEELLSCHAHPVPPGDTVLHELLLYFQLYSVTCNSSLSLGTLATGTQSEAVAACVWDRSHFPKTSHLSPSSPVKHLHRLCLLALALLGCRCVFLRILIYVKD